MGTVLQKQVFKPWLVGVEVYHQTAPVEGKVNPSHARNPPANPPRSSPMEKPGCWPTRQKLGTVYDFSEDHHLLFSAGRSIDGPTDFQCYVAYQWTFDNSLFHLGKRSSK